MENYDNYVNNFNLCLFANYFPSYHRGVTSAGAVVFLQGQEAAIINLFKLEQKEGNW